MAPEDYSREQAIEICGKSTPENRRKSTWLTIIGRLNSSQNNQHTKD
jgi:hypothetical protein